MKTLATALILATTTLAQAQAPATKAQYDKWRTQITHALFVDDPLPAVAPQTFGTFTPMEGVRAERVSFATQFGMRVPAIVYIPEHMKSRAPGMVIVNGHGGDKTSWYAQYAGLLYAKAGAVVVTYDPIGEDERITTRVTGARGHDVPVPGLDPPARVGGLMIEDILQAVRYVEQRSDVDPTRVAVLGFSMGAFQSPVAAAISKAPIRALALTGGGTLDGAGGYWDSGVGKDNCQAGPYKQLNFLGPENRGAILYALRAQAGPTYIMNGLEDPLVVKINELEPFFVDLRNRIAAVTGSRTNLPETIFIPNAGHRPSWLTRPAALWLNKQLQFPNWTEASINALPELAVSERNGKPIPPGTEDRPIPVLDLKIPTIPRDQLQAIPDSEWQQHRDLYVIDAWKTHALATQTPSSH